MSDKPDWVAETRALCDAATPGPWEHVMLPGREDPPESGKRHVAVVNAHISLAITRRPRAVDCDFIATARTALPRALTALEAADALAAAVSDGCGCDQCNEMGDGPCQIETALAAYREARR